jgi:SAM-dependent methyltransferase
MAADVATTLASLYDMRSLRMYIRWKVRSDPAYAAVLARVRDYPQPLLDLGCGVGLLPFYLREHGVGVPMLGIDFDDRKIDVARHAAQRYRGIDFIRGDARGELPEGHNTVVLDILQYFSPADQQRILTQVAKAVAPDGIVVIRSGLRDASWRFRITRAVDAFGRAIRWMRAESLTYPTREEIIGAFDGFHVDVTPLWGGSPFNNYLFVFTRGAARRPE